MNDYEEIDLFLCPEHGWTTEPVPEGDFQLCPVRRCPHEVTPVVALVPSANTDATRWLANAKHLLNQAAKGKE